MRDHVPAVPVYSVSATFCEASPERLLLFDVHGALIVLNQGAVRTGGGITMITVLVQFKLPQPITRDKAREVFLSAAPKYRDTEGLIRKYFVLSEDGGAAGGVYLWKSREDAERLYTNEWKNVVRERYGAPPSVTYFDSPVIVDNQTREILS
jgi:hypothetical protein